MQWWSREKGRAAESSLVSAFRTALSDFLASCLSLHDPRPLGQPSLSLACVSWHAVALGSDSRQMQGPPGHAVLFFGCRTRRPCCPRIQRLRPLDQQPGLEPSVYLGPDRAEVGVLHEPSVFGQMSHKVIFPCISQASQGSYRSNPIAYQYFPALQMEKVKSQNDEVCAWQFSNDCQSWNPCTLHPCRPTSGILFRCISTTVHCSVSYNIE